MRCCDVEALWDEVRERHDRRDEPIYVHLSGCSHCQEMFRANERVVSTLSCLVAVEPPPDLMRRVQRSIEQRCAPRRRTESLCRVSAPIGDLIIAFHDEQISFVAVAQEASMDEVGCRIAHRLRRNIVPAESPAWLQATVQDFFATWHIDLERLDLSVLTPFEQAALCAALSIPPGEVRSYGWIAKEIGRPQAARAVGQAMARNPLALFLPCHRVVDASGALHHYGYGLELKERLLKMEGCCLDGKAQRIRKVSG